MSAIAAKTVNKPITNSGITSVSTAGTSGTDYTSITFDPVGIDNKGVSTFRNSSAGSIAQAENFTFSSGISGSKVKSRLVLHVPADVVVAGVTASKDVIAELRISSELGHTNLNRRQALNLLVLLLGNANSLSSDVMSGASPY
jgi:hypothetical protein